MEQMTMQERIDLLIKARREHPDRHELWWGMYSRLKSIDIPADMKQLLVEQWEAEQLREDLLNWDNLITEVLITGKFPEADEPIKAAQKSILPQVDPAHFNTDQQYMMHQWLKLQEEDKLRRQMERMQQNLQIRYDSGLSGTGPYTNQYNNGGQNK